ncbi:MAG: hypothetical protein ACE5ER_01970 [Nitrospinaceae bacterium]
MLLSKEVIDRNGRVLLAGGNELNQKHLKVFKAWGIADLTVEEPAGQEAPAAAASEKAPVNPKERSLEQQVKRLFHFTDLRHPAVRELFEFVFNRKKEAAG